MGKTISKWDSTGEYKWDGSGFSLLRAPGGEIILKQNDYLQLSKCKYQYPANFKSCKKTSNLKTILSRVLRQLQDLSSSPNLNFLSTLVALHFTPVSESVSQWAEFRTSIASRLASLFTWTSCGKKRCQVFEA